MSAMTNPHYGVCSGGLQAPTKMITKIFATHAHVPAPASVIRVTAAHLNGDTTAVPMSPEYAIICASTIMSMERSPIATLSQVKHFRIVAAWVGPLRGMLSLFSLVPTPPRRLVCSRTLSNCSECHMLSQAESAHTFKLVHACEC